MGERPLLLGRKCRRGYLQIETNLLRRCNGLTNWKIWCRVSLHEFVTGWRRRRMLESASAEKIRALETVGPQELGTYVLIACLYHLWDWLELFRYQWANQSYSMHFRRKQPTGGGPLSGARYCWSQPVCGTGLRQHDPGRNQLWKLHCQREWNLVKNSARPGHRVFEIMSAKSQLMKEWIERKALEDN